MIVGHLQENVHILLCTIAKSGKQDAVIALSYANTRAIIWIKRERTGGLNEICLPGSRIWRLLRHRNGWQILQDSPS